VSIENPFNEKVTLVITAIAEGQTIDPVCPYCDSPGLEFSFTYVPPEKYGLYISCPVCREWVHTRLLSRPPGFDERYVLEKYQRLEERVVNLVGKLLEDADLDED
jgi:hypothetical protein